jgi:uncharacterized protein
MRRLLLALLALLVLAPAAHALPEGAEFTQTTIASGDGTRLQVDVIRAEGTPETARQPVIMVVSPYTVRQGGRPSNRFDDFFDLSGALQKGYTYVIVTMRSFGTSQGCSDWGGPGEQRDVVAGVEWAARQPWSNGKVALFGKSYDAWTGLMGIANQPRGLAAVISMEPVYDGYKYLYDEGIRFVNSALTPTSFMTTAQPRCAAEYVLSQQDDDEHSAFWRARELTSRAAGKDTPLFLMQGFLERNTKPEGFVDFWEGVAGPKRAWFGQYDHVRGYEMQGEELATGRDGFVEESMTFLDAYLKGDRKAERDWLALPQVEAQDSLGRWRGEDAWPPRDAVRRVTQLRPGAYTDTGANLGSREGSAVTLPAAPTTGLGHWSISQPLPRATHMAGEPKLDLDLVTAAPRANLVANVYDIAPDGKATLVSRGAKMLRTPGIQRTELALYGQDWVFAEGHRIGVLVSGSNAEWWVHQPTQAPVVIRSAFASLPLLRTERTSFLEGGDTPRLRQTKANAVITVPAPVVTASETRFDIGDADPAPAGGRRAARGR